MPEPTNDGPFHIPLPSISPSDHELNTAHQAPPNAHQLALAKLAANLPTGAANLDKKAVSTAEKSVPGKVSRDTVEDALNLVKDGLTRFLG